MSYILVLLSSLTVEADSHVHLLRQLLKEDSAALAATAKEKGDARRGAIVFYQPGAACTTCHTSSDGGRQLGPNLARIGKVTGEHIVDSVLRPSKVISKGFETVSILTKEEQTYTGFIDDDKGDRIVLRDASQNGKLVTIAREDVEARKDGVPSIMPEGLVNQLASRQQFLDLVNYLIEIAHAGPTHADALKPDASLYTVKIPEYEKDIDHAGMIRDLESRAKGRGQKIYERVCMNCHGTHEMPGSLPTSLKFAKDKFKHGSDPFTMYQTLTHGFGMMQPQPWMVPQEKYDVVHYIRDAYLKTHNASQYIKVDNAYLAALPKGKSRGPAPKKEKQWVEMDYGPHLMGTWEISNRDGSNITYKSIALRLDPGPGGISRGKLFQTFDHDTLRMAAGWSGEFLDWKGINFDGRHAIHPRIGGAPSFANPVGPGWAHPETGSWEDPRIRGRDDKPYGPLPRDWAHYKGLYMHGQKIIIKYTVGQTEVMEMPGLTRTTAGPVYTRTFNIGPRRKDMIMQVARHPGAAAAIALTSKPDSRIVLGPNLKPAEPEKERPKADWPGFNGATYLEIAKSKDFEMTNRDYTIYARVKTRKGGTIFCRTDPGNHWRADGKTLFIRGGRLTMDIGWVGAANGKTNVADGKEHEVAMCWEHEAGLVHFYVDGKFDGLKRLKPKAHQPKEIVRIGVTALNFPRGQTYFKGEMPEVRFYSKAFSDEEMKELTDPLNDDDMVGHWKFDAVDGTVKDLTDKGHSGKIIMGKPAAAPVKTDVALVAGTAGEQAGFEWLKAKSDLRLKIPAGDRPIKWTLWIGQTEKLEQTETMLSETSIDDPAQDLARLTKGGAKRWDGEVVTEAKLGKADGPFAVDVLTYPSKSPWFCRARLTGFDFLDADRAVVSAWEGSMWLVSGLEKLSTAEPGSTQPIRWRRIASGLFQPLGVKYVDGKIYVTCRDQLAIIHDLNGDGEIDHIESFNNDHQVTEHFHEFAMGLQSDKDGNFYYAKSARHAKTALVPHHGTLLRISKDGLKTDILATGFRAANGVCVNPDGSFIVTDQEGHWNPKNRINWVVPGNKFYGNMYGYHDVTDSSDEAMEPPLVWITNRFDRSPSELLWVDSEKWGSLDKKLLNLSYGYGKVYVVPHEKVNGRMQGGMCAFPIPKFPTGVMRGRYHPKDRQLYLAGMFAWAGSAHQPGGFYRLRYTGKPAFLPIGLSAKKNGMSITFSDEIDSEFAADASNYAVKIWGLKRTSGYGSRHYNEKKLEVAGARAGEDGRTVFVEIPKIETTWCMEIKCKLKGKDGKQVERVIHNTVHTLGE
ncbi:MAG: c-type cytochrome [Planctomycetota bacterium]|nr:c-type cytochrome [Planctomycetota bacterium]